MISNICTISLTENTAFVKLFELSLGSGIFALFTEFHCHGMDNFGYIWVPTLEIYIQGGFLLQEFQSVSVKYRGAVAFGDL